MTDRYMLTPYFIDERRPGIDDLATSDWQENRPVLNPGEKQERMVTLYKPLAAFIADTLQQGDRPVSVAGDCCTTIGVLAGIQQAGLTPTIIWFDAHGDFNTWETSPSGFLGGMPLAMAVGLGEQTMLDGLGSQPSQQMLGGLVKTRAPILFCISSCYQVHNPIRLVSVGRAGTSSPQGLR